MGGLSKWGGHFFHILRSHDKFVIPLDVGLWFICRSWCLLIWVPFIVSIRMCDVISWLCRLIVIPELCVVVSAATGVLPLMLRSAQIDCVFDLSNWPRSFFCPRKWVSEWPGVIDPSVPLCSCRFKSCSTNVCAFVVFWVRECSCLRPCCFPLYLGLLWCVCVLGPRFERSWL